ncbi:MAG TPA: hypothetical protein VHL34_10740 [Rhizomicrobium sp.]|jgi:hypothetical protein|nr:hypothetical protein [Rhizomicrobium sp.]
MLRLVCLIGGFVALLSAYSSAGHYVDPDEWRPDANLVASIDAQALKHELPKEFGSLSDYARYYFGTAFNKRRVVEGFFLSPQIGSTRGHPFKPGIFIVGEQDVPVIGDGGCIQVVIEYDVAEGRITQSDCNGEVPPPPPPEPVKVDTTGTPH